MIDLLSANQYFFILLTLVSFAIGSLIQKKWKYAILNPLLIGAVLVILTLSLLGIPNSTYQAGCHLLNYLLTPATICLAISFYEQFQTMKKHIGAILVSLVVGTICCLGSLYLLCRMAGLDRVLTLSLLPKSITTAIGVALSEEIGGIAAITSASIVVTGILANIAGPTLCKLLKIHDPIAQGVSFGTAGHVIGTSRAAEMSELAGAVSSFALTCTGIFTCIVLSLTAQFL